jgi:hypothetical protein
MVNTPSAVSIGHAAKVLGLLCLSLWLWPIYQSGMESVLRATIGVSRVQSNNALEVAAFAVWVPIAFAWRRSRRLGAMIQIGLLLGLVAWLYTKEPSALQGWLSYSMPLLGACAAMWVLMLGGGVARGALRSGRATSQKGKR